MNTFGISGHANVTNIGRDNITYEIIDDGAAAGTYEKVASIDERLRVVRDERLSTLILCSLFSQNSSYDLVTKILTWLAAPDSSANYVAARGKYQSGTGTWFSQLADFEI